MKIKNDQLELTLNHKSTCPSVARRQRRLSRAAFWFDRMRQVVDDAVDYHPAPTSRSEQIWVVRS
jgi:hypothetical protein